ncbi:plasmid mobilization relaxosome protein MobC [Epilithonimonas sp.]|uniref:plasmid mobilization relaxosome protein MobC n=1 Tax=Epilithonimonas sp. TaxID=2894511 RepID=UPI00289BEC70|nr:plasmid mobilization relaxosome protein MobC [Epilithonimonas sp.]
MENDRKKDTIILRVQKTQKEKWKKICQEKKISITSLIVNSVEERMMDDERRKVLSFIEKQDNVFVKIETNINQVAKIVNIQKSISPKNLNDFLERLSEITTLKQEQNKIFENIYALLSK